MLTFWLSSWNILDCYVLRVFNKLIYLYHSRSLYLSFNGHRLYIGRKNCACKIYIYTVQKLVDIKYSLVLEFISIANLVSNQQLWNPILENLKKYEVVVLDWGFWLIETSDEIARCWARLCNFAAVTGDCYIIIFLSLFLNSNNLSLRFFFWNSGRQNNSKTVAFGSPVIDKALTLAENRLMVFPTIMFLLIEGGNLPGFVPLSNEKTILHLRAGI